MNVTPVYDDFLYYWFMCANTELSLVVGWFKAELLRVLRCLLSVLCEEEAWVVINRNYVDSKAVCRLLGRFCQVKL